MHAPRVGTFILVNGHELQNGRPAFEFSHSDSCVGPLLRESREQFAGNHDGVRRAVQERFQGLIADVQLAYGGAAEPPSDIAEKARAGPPQAHLSPWGFVQAQALRLPGRSPVQVRHVRKIGPKSEDRGVAPITALETERETLRRSNVVVGVLWELGVDFDHEQFFVVCVGHPSARLKQAGKRIQRQRVAHLPGAIEGQCLGFQWLPRCREAFHLVPARGALAPITAGTPTIDSFLRVAPRAPISISRTFGFVLVGCSMVTTNLWPSLSSIAFR